MSDIKKRILTGSILIPVFIALLYLEGIFLSVFIVAALLIAYKEYIELLKKIYQSSPQLIGYLILLGLILVFLTVNKMSFFFGAFIISIILASSVYPFYFSRGIKFSVFSAVLFGSFYLAIGGGSVFWIRKIGFMTALVLFLIIWTFDTGAYAFGILFGRKKLLYSVSPGKTLEGLAGGVLTAVILGFILYHFGYFPVSSIPEVLSVILVVCGTSQLGDLMESAVKREAGVKDTSGLLPGHGGALDRIDSILLAAPSYWLLLELLT